MKTKNPEYRLITEKLYSSRIEIAEIESFSKRCKGFNQNLMLAMNKMIEIKGKNKIYHEDIVFLKRLKIFYADQAFNESTYSIFGKDIKKNILNATLLEVLQRYEGFVDDRMNELWNSYLNNLRIELIKFDLNHDVIFMIKFIEDLMTVFTKIQLDFKKYVFTSVSQLFDNQFNFITYASAVDVETDINKQKKYYLEAIAYCDMFCLKFNVKGDFEEKCISYKQKCLEAIKIIDFQLFSVKSMIDLSEKENIPVDIDQSKLFHEYLLHEKNEQLAEGLKKEFSKERGKKLRLMIEALKLIQPPLFTLIPGEKKGLYNSLKNYFNKDIGTYNSIFLCDFESEKDKSDIDSVLIRVNHVLSKL